MVFYPIYYLIQICHCTKLRVNISLSDLFSSRRCQYYRQHKLVTTTVKINFYSLLKQLTKNQNNELEKSFSVSNVTVIVVIKW